MTHSRRKREAARLARKRAKVLGEIRYLEDQLMQIEIQERWKRIEQRIARVS